jgi:hypothetical protein
MVEPLRHRQTKGAATDMFYLTPPRHISTLPIPATSMRTANVRSVPHNRTICCIRRSRALRRGINRGVWVTGNTGGLLTSPRGGRLMEVLVACDSDNCDTGHRVPPVGLPSTDRRAHRCARRRRQTAISKTCGWRWQERLVSEGVDGLGAFHPLQFIRNPLTHNLWVLILFRERGKHRHDGAIHDLAVSTMTSRRQRSPADVSCRRQFSPRGAVVDRRPPPRRHETKVAANRASGFSVESCEPGKSA